MADIEHSELPDELLHEPKGASKAEAGQVYIADGLGSGNFSKVPVTSLDIIKTAIDNLAPNGFAEMLSIDTSNLTQGTDQVLENIVTDILPITVLNDINKNTAEFAALYARTVTIVEQIELQVTRLKTKVNEILTALKNEGLVDDE